MHDLFLQFKGWGLFYGKLLIEVDHPDQAKRNGQNRTDHKNMVANAGDHQHGQTINPELDPFRGKTGDRTLNRRERLDFLFDDETDRQEIEKK